MNSALQHALAPIQAEFYTNKSLPTEGGLVRMYLHIVHVCIHLLQDSLVDIMQWASIHV